jgi:hypothetical protein
MEVAAFASGRIAHGGGCTTTMPVEGTPVRPSAFFIRIAHRSERARLPAAEH